MVQMNRFAGQKLRHRCREQTYGHQGGKAAVGGGGGVMNWAIGIDMYTLMCIKWMTNKNLLYKKINKIKFKKKCLLSLVTSSTGWGRGKDFVCFAHCHIPAPTMGPTGTQMFVEGMHEEIFDSKVHAFHDTALLH